jgi:hypothetical protein
MGEKTASFGLKGLATGPRLRWQSMVLGFSDGFVGGVLGGASYRLLMRQLHAEGWECPWGRVVLVALLLGCFEAWRATRRAHMEDFKWRMLWLIGTSTFVFWTLSAFVLAPAPVVQPPQRLEVRQGLRRDLWARDAAGRANELFEREVGRSQ